MTRSIVEEWGLLVKWPSKNDAHRWRRSDDRRTMRPTGRGEYGNNRVQEIVSGTHRARLNNNIESATALSSWPLDKWGALQMDSTYLEWHEPPRGSEVSHHYDGQRDLLPLNTSFGLGRRAARQ